MRYGIGGELQSPYAAFAANYYLPITDDKRQGANVAFSQKGYDANLRINIPQMDYLKLRGDYYHFDGKYGGEDDKGFRYGLEVQPISDLRIGVFYDDGGEKFGGDIVYVYNFGIPQKRESTCRFFARFIFADFAGIFTTDFDNTTEQIEVLRTPISVHDGNNDNSGNDVFTTIMTMAEITTTTFNNGNRITMTEMTTRTASVYAIYVFVR